MAETEQASLLLLPSQHIDHVGHTHPSAVVYWPVVPPVMRKIRARAPAAEFGCRATLKNESLRTQHPRPNCSSTTCKLKRSAQAYIPLCHLPTSLPMRHRGDSNPCGQRPMDFESISLATRTQCLACQQHPARRHAPSCQHRGGGSPEHLPTPIKHCTAI